MRRSSSDVVTKSAGRSRKDSSLLTSSQRANKSSPHPKISSMTDILASIDSISEEEKKLQYENYEKTGDFEKDFICLSLLSGIKLTIGNRSKLPGLSNSPDSDNEKKSLSGTLSQEKIKLQCSVSQDNIKVNSILNTDKMNTLTQVKGVEEDNSPQTYVIAKDKYNYFKPRLEVETEFDHVKSLYLRGWKADMRVMDVLARTLPELDKLTALNMWNAGLDDNTLRSLGECLSSISSLKTLCLDGNSFVTNQEFHLFLQEPSKLNLQHLSLRHCKINQVGALTLSTALSDNKHLLTLNLCFNKLGDEGVRLLAQALCFNRTLLSLNVSNNEIGDEGVQHIARALSRFPLTEDQVFARRRQLSQLNESLNESLVSSQQEKSILTIHQAHGKISREKTSKKKDSKGKGSKGKTNWDKAKTIKSATKMEATKTGEDESDVGDSNNINDPLLEKAVLVNGELWLPGNRALINLNLSRNKMSRIGLELLYAAIKYQDELTIETKANGHFGLIKLSLQNNCFLKNDATYASLLQLLTSRDPLQYQCDFKSEENGY